MKSYIIWYMNSKLNFIRVIIIKINYISIIINIIIIIISIINNFIIIVIVVVFISGNIWWDWMGYAINVYMEFPIVFIIGLSQVYLT